MIANEKKRLKAAFCRFGTFVFQREANLSGSQLLCCGSFAIANRGIS